MKSWPKPSSWKAERARSLTRPGEALAKDISGSNCRQTVEAFLQRLDDREPAVRAFVDVQPERLLRESDCLDRSDTDQHGPLFGMLVAVKEIFDVSGYRCSWGTEIHRDRIPQTDAIAVKRLKAADALIAGTTVSTEYALARTGPTTNPHDPARTPGASSQGSAAAVGAGLTDVAIGSQTIGSVIRPAAYCGCIGFKPTWNLCSLSGAMPLSLTLDHIGLIARNPMLVRRLLSVLSDNPVAPTPVGRLRQLRPWFSEMIDPAMFDACTKTVSLLSADYEQAGELYLPESIASQEESLLEIILAAGMSRSHGRDLDHSADLMSERVAGLIRKGRDLTPATLDRTLALRSQIADQVDGMIGDDILIMPATTGIAPLLSDGTGSRSPQRLWSLTGQPAITVPVSHHQGLPVGVQLIAARRHDDALLAVAERLYQATARAND